MESRDEGRIPDAVTEAKILIRGLKENRQDHQAWNALGEVYSRLGNYKKADSCFAIALSLDPNNPEYTENKIKNLSILQDTELSEPPEKIPVKTAEKPESVIEIPVLKILVIALLLLLGVMMMPYISGFFHEADTEEPINTAPPVSAVQTEAPIHMPTQAATTLPTPTPSPTTVVQTVQTTIPTQQPDNLGETGSSSSILTVHAQSREEREANNQTSPTKATQMYEFSGAAYGKTETFHLAPGEVRIEFTVGDPYYNGGMLKDEKGNLISFIVSQGIPGSGSKTITLPSGGNYYLDMSSSNWKVTVSQ